jgi:hypothetical protein
VIELVHAPAIPGSGCHVVVEEIDMLVAGWKRIGVDVRVVEHGGERDRGGRSGRAVRAAQAAARRYQPLARPRRRAPRRRGELRDLGRRDRLDPRRRLRESHGHGGTDAEPRWIHPRGIPRPGQRGVDSSGRIVVRSFSRVAEGGGRGDTERGT